MFHNGNAQRIDHSVNLPRLSSQKHSQRGFAKWFSQRESTKDFPQRESTNGPFWFSERESTKDFSTFLQWAFTKTLFTTGIHEGLFLKPSTTGIHKGFVTTWTHKWSLWKALHNGDSQRILLKPFHDGNSQRMFKGNWQIAKMKGFTWIDDHWDWENVLDGRLMPGTAPLALFPPPPAVKNTSPAGGRRGAGRELWGLCGLRRGVVGFARAHMKRFLDRSKKNIRSKQIIGLKITCSAI